MHVYISKSLYWCIVDSQCCTNFCYPAEWLSYTYMYSFPLWFIMGHWIQSLCCTAGPCCPSIWRNCILTLFLQACFPWVIVQRVAKSWTRLMQLSTHSECSWFTILCSFQVYNKMTHIHISIHFQILFPCRLLQNIEYSSLCATVGPCWLSILYIVGVVCYSQTPNLSLFPQPFPFSSHKFVFYVCEYASVYK